MLRFTPSGPKIVLVTAEYETRVRGLLSDSWIRRIDPQRRREVDQVFLLLCDDLAQGFAERVFVHGVSLLDAAAVVRDCDTLVFEIKFEHLLGLVGGFDGFGSDRG